MIAGLDARGRLRHAAETAGGARVFVSREDLLAVVGGPAPAAAAQPPEGTPVQSRMAQEPPAEIPRVILPVDREHSYRLARAAWDSDPDRVGQLGTWHEQEYGVREALANAAQRSLELLAGAAGPVVPGPRAPEPVPARAFPSNEDDPPPF